MKNFLLGLLAGAGIIVVVGTSVYFFWRQPLITHKANAATPAVTTSVPTVVAPSALPNIGEVPSPDAPQMTQAMDEVPEAAASAEAGVPNQISWTIRVDEENFVFDDWNSVQTELAKSDDKNVELWAEFDKDILSNVPEIKFRDWLARVGDYIYARRVLLSQDQPKNMPGGLISVVRDEPLMRTRGPHVHKRGCALLVDQGQRWQVKIRGLEYQPDELAIVGEEILLKAITEPSSMAECTSINLQKIGKCFGAKELTVNQTKLMNWFVKYFTRSTAMKNALADEPETLTDLGNFLPLLALTELPYLNQEDLDYIKNAHTGFFNEFYRKVGPGFKDDAEVKECFTSLAVPFRVWADTANLSVLFKNSLFKRAE
jgi:hypothetical protein